MLHTEFLSGKIDLLLRAASEVLERCPCKNGCPSCVGPAGNKAAAVKLVNIIV